MLRVLWFACQPLPAFAEDLGLPIPVRGGWMSSLADGICKGEGVELAVATAMPVSRSTKVKSRGVTNYAIAAQTAGGGERAHDPERALIARCTEVFEDFAPDLVHVHGTEYFYGLLTARGHLRVPALVSIQGLISECRKFYFGGLSLADVRRCQSVPGFIRGSGLVRDSHRWSKRAGSMEPEILAGHRHFTGRTLWDRAHVRAVNPGAAYYHCDDIIRDEFFQAQPWTIRDRVRHSIFAASASYPLKGFHWLLRAGGVLLRDFPDLTIRVADWGGRRTRYRSYTNYLLDLAEEVGLRGRVTPLGEIGPARMAEEFRTAHCFVAPSLVENGCNALHEAMIIGTPAVVSLAGGMTSMVEDRHTALGCPPSDDATMAECIRMIFSNDELAGRMSAAGREVARPRHASDRNTRTMVAIYRDVLAAETGVT